MVKVIKRSGKEVDFNISNVETSIISAGDDIGNPLSTGDIKNITKDLLKLVEGKDKITTKQIYEYIIISLRNMGFNDVADSYIKFAGNYWV